MVDPFYSQADTLFSNADRNTSFNLEQFYHQYKNLHAMSSNIEMVYYLGNKLKKLTSKLNSLKTIRIAVLSNSTCIEIENYLRSLLFNDKFHLEFYSCEYNQIFSDIANIDSELYTFQPNIIFLLIDEQAILDLTNDLSISAIQKSTADFFDYLQYQITFLTAHSNAHIIINSMVIPKILIDSYIDYQTKNFLNLSFCEFNKKIYELATHLKQMSVLDTNTFLQKYNVSLRDERLASYAEIRWHTSLFYQFSFELVKIVRAQLGLSKKCLIVDLDNTLWGGVIGDDGIQGVKLGGNEEGKAYKKFQKTLKQLKNQGVILAINSKNESEAVTEMFNSHPDTVLKLEDFVAIKTNWLPKHENIESIVTELNIGLDSIVFTDDNIAECSLVSGFLPDVAICHLPNDPTLYISSVLEQGHFNKLELTHEDKLRTSDYQAEVKRKKLLTKYENYENYLTDLSISIRVFSPTDFELSRISQLTLRTNQFNLSNQRYTVSHLEEIRSDGFILGVESSDRFGSNGIIGALIARKINNDIEILNFVLSCRVFSRKIEHTALIIFMNYAKQMNFSSIICKYFPTRKNKIVRNFLSSESFKCLSKTTDYELLSNDLNQISDIPKWITYKTQIGNLYDHAYSS